MKTEQELHDLREAVRELAQRVMAPRAAEVDAKGEFPWDYVQALREQGLFGLAIPEEYGGLGAGFEALAVAVEELSRVDAVGGLLLAVQVLGTLPIILGGSPEQKARFLPPAASGEWLAAFGLTEPEAGSDAAHLTTRAVRKGDRYYLTGRKHFITNAGVAGLYVVFARTGEEGPRGISAFVVDPDTPGFSIGRLQHKMGIRGSTTGELIFEEAEVPVENRLGEEGDGFRIAMATLDRTRSNIAAQALGIAQGALDLAVRYAAERRQFGQPIGQFQGIQFMLADMATQVEAARQLTYHACRALDKEGLSLKRMSPAVSRLAAMAKLYASDVAMKVTEDAVQILGGYGYMVDYPAERMMRDAKITQIYEGTNQIQRWIIGRSLLEDMGHGRG